MDMSEFEFDVRDKHSGHLHSEIEKRLQTFDNKLSLEREFAANTTLHGANRFIDSRRPTWVRLIWILIFAVCLVACVWEIYLQSAAFFEYSTISKISTKYESELEFPAITICNFNRYQSSKVTKYLQQHNITMISHSEDFLEDSSTESHAFDSVQSEADIDMYNFTLETGFELSPRNLRECTWRGQRCGSQNFSHIFTKYGNCYTFNKHGPKLFSIQPGERNSLHFVIDIQQDEDSDIFEIPEAGLKILVHDPEEIPLIDSLGDAAPPGFHTFIGIKQTLYKNLEKPWGVCDKKKRLKYQDVYTLSGCIQECRMVQFITFCSCKPLGYPWGSEDYCSGSQLTDCAIGVAKKFDAGDYGPCECPVPCNFSDFESSMSYAAYPNNAIAHQLHEQYGVNETYLKNNFVSVDAFYEELNYQLVEEIEALSFSSLISNIGGQAGLFLGGSMITLAEIIEYILRRTNRSCCENKKIPQTLS